MSVSTPAGPRAARPWRAAFAATLALGLALTVGACEKEDPDKGTNGVGKLEPQAVNDKARAAANGAGSVRLAGTLLTGGKTYTLDMRLGKDGGTGQVKAQDATFTLLRVGDTLWVKAGAAFWGTSESAAKLGDKYVKVPEKDPSYARFRGFTEMRVLLDGLLGMTGKLTKGPYGDVDGDRVVPVLADEGKGGRMSVALTGTPYPLRMERGGGAGAVTLSDWGGPVALDAPPAGQVVDYGSQLPTGPAAGGKGGGRTGGGGKGGGTGSTGGGAGSATAGAGEGADLGPGGDPNASPGTDAGPAGPDGTAPGESPGTEPGPGTDPTESPAPDAGAVGGASTS
ncbi:hypothetical protein ACN20G_07505 [Streptomyces sp. BI20]|uniref:hypothetical protein n=1 Tax=Streptomyces sp. BI20 TaxID=3403460 RepID=UPI003C70FFDA